MLQKDITETVQIPQGATASYASGSLTLKAEKGEVTRLIRDPKIDISVKDNEVIIVNVDMGSTYRKSKIPRSLQMVIPKSLINDYAKGGISLEKQINTKNHPKTSRVPKTQNKNYYSTTHKKRNMQN